MGTYARYKVVELFDPNDSLPRFVAACRSDREPLWRTTWLHREELDSKLSLWFRQLAARGQEPEERSLLGRNVPLDEKCARSLAAFRIEEIAKMAGSWPSLPDFLCHERHIGGRGYGRPVWANGVRYESVSAAAKAAGITRRAVFDRLRHGGWNWA